jgi:branched-chain amino acid transport system permease protein
MQNIVFGIITGSILAIASAGFALIRQTDGFINVAHGQMLALGALLGFVFVDSVGLNILVAGALVFVVVGALGVALTFVVFKPVQDSGGMVLLFTSVGLAWVLYAVIVMVFGPELRIYAVDFGARLEFLSVSITVAELVIVALALATSVSLHLFFTFTRLGTSVRAIASNAELARLRGVKVNRVSATVWFIASGLAGMAGVCIGVIGQATIETGWTTLLLILAASILGGLGRIYGVMAAALLLGLVMDLSALVISTEYRSVVAFAALILVLIVRPDGLFTLDRRHA